MIWIILQAVIFIAVPALLLVGENRFRLIRRISAVVLCYVTGILLGNVPVVPLDTELTTITTQLAVVLAVPLLLFAMDIPRWMRLARRTILSFGLGVAAVLLVSTAAGLIFAGRVEGAWQVSGMLVGVYTGGTPNMSAIAIGLGVPADTFILLNAIDLSMGSIYLLCMVTFGRRVLLRFLPAFRSGSGAMVEGPAGGSADPDVPAPEPALEPAPEPAPEPALEPAPEPAPESGAVSFRGLGPGTVLTGLGSTLGVAGMAIALSYALTGSISAPLVIIAITTLGIAGSFTRPVKRLRGTYEMGQYLLLVFCIAIGTEAHVMTLIRSLGTLFAFTAFVMWGSIVLHLALAALFRIDADTVIITSTAAVMSPAFVGPVANALGNREIVVSGLTTGVVGYAVGNYLGLGLAGVLRSVLGG